MTEDEAKTKWCPFARVGNAFGNMPVNRGLNEETPSCIASACMAWRQTVMIDRTTGEQGILGISKLEHLEPRWSDHGFCGLAGAPNG